MKIGRPYISDAPAWYPYFFNLVTGDDLIGALQTNKQQVLEFISAIPPSAEDFRYAENK
jgi:hypothetical protein